MIIADTPGDTIQISAGANTTITITLYGIEKDANGDNNYKMLARGVATTGTTTLYTVPADTSTIVSQVVVANTTSSNSDFTIWHVPNAGSAADGNVLYKEVSLEKNQTFTWGRE